MTLSEQRKSRLHRKSNQKISPSERLQWLVHLAAFILMGWLAWDYIMGNLGVNPIQAAMQRSGKYALIFLLLSLACTPLNIVFGWRQALGFRRVLGLYAFFLAGMHVLIFVGLDYGFDLELLTLEFTQKRFVIVGAAAFLILLSLAITSFQAWQKRLGKNWKRLHRLIYLAGGLVIVHFAWARKGDLLRLQGDIWQPLLFGVFWLLLMLVRLPVVRNGFQHLRRLV